VSQGINNRVFVIKSFKMPNFTNVELTDMLQRVASANTVPGTVSRQGCIIAIIKFWTSFFCHIKKNTLNHALLKLSHMNDEIVKFITNLSI
jgi:hypothetical protein